MHFYFRFLLQPQNHLNSLLSLHLNQKRIHGHTLEEREEN